MDEALSVSWDQELAKYGPWPESDCYSYDPGAKNIFMFLNGYIF